MSARHCAIAASEYVVLAASCLFDEVWYLDTYSDVAQAGVDPYEHFNNQGWREGRNPGPYFDVKWYVKQYSNDFDVEMNPLLDYLLHGWVAGRHPYAGYDEGTLRSEHPELTALRVPPIEYLAALQVFARGVRS